MAESEWENDPVGGNRGRCGTGAPQTHLSIVGDSVAAMSRHLLSVCAMPGVRTPAPENVREVAETFG